MRIFSIKLVNFRQYKNLEIEFPKAACDLHLLVGRNGVGKTTLLNAINWCMYEEESLITKQEHALPIVNINTIKNSKDGEQVPVEVSICFYDEENVTSTRFTRQSIYSIHGKDARLVSSDFSALEFKDSESMLMKREAATRLLARLLPKAIKEFFFFDGERLDDYFSQQQSSQRVRKAVFDISQVQVVNAAKKRIDDVINNLTRETGKGIPSLEKIIERIEGKRNEKKDIESKLVEARHQLKVATETIRECDNYLRNIPDIQELEIERSRKLADEKQAKSNEERLLQRAREFIREYTTLFASYEALNRTSSLIKDKKQKDELPPSIDRELLKEILTKEVCSICGTRLSSDSRARIESILEQVKMGTQLANRLLNIEPLVDQMLDQIVDFPKQRDRLINEWKSVESNTRQISQRLDEIDRKLSGYGNKSEIKEKQELRKNNEIVKNRLTVTIVAAQSNLSRIQSDLKSFEDERDDILKKSSKLSVARLRLKWLKEAVKTLDETETTLMKMNKTQIEANTNSIFKELIWKKSSFDRVEIDDDYGLWLYNSDNYSCLSNISAAERALLALSYTIALHRVSGFEPPLIIDTPVSRISDDNRRNFAKVLLEVSKQKQIILLFTPAEFSEEIMSVFADHAASKHEIELINEQEVGLR